MISPQIVEIDDLCTDDLLCGASALTEDIDEEDECIILEQPIHMIRMWGVGRDKDR